MEVEGGGGSVRVLHPVPTRPPQLRANITHWEYAHE